MHSTGLPFDRFGSPVTGYLLFPSAAVAYKRTSTAGIHGVRLSLVKDPNIFWDLWHREIKCYCDVSFLSKASLETTPYLKAILQDLKNISHYLEECFCSLHFIFILRVKA